VRELSLPFGIPLRVVQLTDHHAGPYMTREDLRRYADAVIALEPDLFVLTGDYVSNSIAFLPGCLEEMARVRARYGTFATLGNHEHWVANPDRLRAAFRQYGVPLLYNAHRVIRTGKGPFAVVGIDDMRFGNHDLTPPSGGATGGSDDPLPTGRDLPEAAGRGSPHAAGHYHRRSDQAECPAGTCDGPTCDPLPRGLPHRRLAPVREPADRHDLHPGAAWRAAEITVFHLTRAAAQLRNGRNERMNEVATA
jgi:hypothetical protein